MVVEEFVKEIMNTDIKDKIKCILEFSSPKEDKDFNNVYEDLLVYSSLTPIDELKAKFESELINNPHVLIVLKDDQLDDKEKVKLKMETYAKILEIIKNKGYKVWVHILLSNDIFQISMDSKFGLFDIWLKAKPIYDDGTYEIYKVCLIHKNMVLSTFKNYVVAYVMGGSYVKGRFTKESDLDVYVVIDDTDVKKHTFLELKQRLYSMISQMALEAMAYAGTKRILHPQVYTLTEFWKAISESNPVIITFLRDGLALYDRGMFIAWKTLLLKGEIKPSEEAVEKYFTISTNAIQDVKRKLKELLFIDIPEIMLLSAQAAIMNYGLLPTDPKETPEYLKRIFVEEKKILEPTFPEKLKEIIKIRKDIEHGKKESVTGKEVDEWLKIAEEFVSRMKNLKSQVDKEKEREKVSLSIETLYGLIDEAEVLFGKKIEEIIEDKIPTIKEKFEKVKEEIKKYEKGELDVVDLSSLRKNIEEITSSLKHIISARKMNLLSKYKFEVIRNNIRYDVYVIEDRMFVIGDEIIEYEISEVPKRIGTYDKSRLEEVIIPKLLNNAKTTIDKKILKMLDAIFGEYELSITT